MYLFVLTHNHIRFRTNPIHHPEIIFHCNTFVYNKNLQCEQNLSEPIDQFVAHSFITAHKYQFRVATKVLTHIETAIIFEPRVQTKQLLGPTEIH